MAESTLIEAQADNAAPKALAPAPTASPLDLPAQVFRDGLDRRKANRGALMDWIREALVNHVDYGRIHIVSKHKCSYARHGRMAECMIDSHWSKPVLFKPGAEKICGMLGVTVHFPTLPDYEQAALAGAAIHNVILRCEIHDAGGRVVADGIGARALEKDYGDLNKALKMAEKSSHIDATLRLAGLSELFTQDLDDMTTAEAPQAGTPAGSAASMSSAPADDPSGGGSEPSGANEADELRSAHRRLEARIQTLGLSRVRVKQWVAQTWGVQHLNQLSRAQYRAVGARLKTWAAQVAAEQAAAVEHAEACDPHPPKDTQGEYPHEH